MSKFDVAQRILDEALALRRSSPSAENLVDSASAVTRAR